MSTLIDDNTRANIDSAKRLRNTTTAVRLSFTWFGTRKTLTPGQTAQAADTFGAESEFLSAGKKLIDTRHPRFKAVTSIRSRIVSYWKGMSLPYPEPAIRLVRFDDVDTINLRLTAFRAELNEAVEQLDAQYEALKASARERLGSLFSASDYPTSLEGLFEVAWDFPSVEPPSYLQQLAPEIYEQQCRQVAARFDEAVGMAEQAFIEELSKLVSHLAERLSGQDDGKPKIFRDSAVGNLRQFFARFQSLNVRSNEQLDGLVDQCGQIVQGVEPRDLRDRGDLRRQVATELAGVQSVLDGLLVDRPRRNILRKPR